MNYDIFNGDADGICALLQLRLAEPRAAQYVTGVKRDIELVGKITAIAGDVITVLDISLAKNIKAIQACLKAGANVFYVDHHQTGDIPAHPNFFALLNTDANTCTSLLVNQFLNGQYQLWAIVGAFGDNLHQSALAKATALKLTAAQIELLEQLGTYLNYNAYGAVVSDLHFAPEALLQRLLPYASPFDFIENDAALFEQLHTAYATDLFKANQISPEFVNDAVYVAILPDEAWARRVSGVYSNLLTNENPQRAHAILTYCGEDDFQVSVRAALQNKQGAEVFCSKFPTGGGRAAAAGINHLPRAQLDHFTTAMAEFFKN